MVKPAGLISYSEGITLRPSRSTFTSEDEVIPAVERDEAIGCSEVDAYFPLILADLIADAEGGLWVSDAHGSLLLAEVCQPYNDILTERFGQYFKRRPIWVLA